MKGFLSCVLMSLMAGSMSLHAGNMRAEANSLTGDTVVSQGAGLAVMKADTLLPKADTLVVDSAALAANEAITNDMAELRAAINKVLAEDSLVNVKYNILLDEIVERYKSESAVDDDYDNPFFVRLMPPLTLYSSPMRSALKTDSIGQDEDAMNSDRALLPWEKDLALLDELDKVLLMTYLENPSRVRRTEAQLMENKGVSTEAMKKATDTSLKNVGIAGTIENISAAPASDMVVKKPNFWTTKGTMSNQWAENYYTSNWYQGGTSNLNILSLITFDANYNDKQKVTWSNKLEAKVGFYLNNFYKGKDDGRGTIQSNTDLLRITSTLGLKAIKNWSYSVQLQSYTQMMNQYTGENLRSCFLSPSYGSLSIGMNFSKAFENKKGSMTVFVGPITYNCRYVRDQYVLEHSGYIPKEVHRNEEEAMFHHYYDDYGSKVEVNMNYTLAKNLTAKGRFFYYTTLKYVQTETEFTFNYQVSKYLSTQLYLNPRFDDSRAKNDKLGYLMFKEYLTLGFNYTW